MHTIFPSPENDQIYGPITDADPKVQELYDSIEEIGLQEPITITTLFSSNLCACFPWQAIDDTTRPTELNDAWWNPAEFFKHEFENFLSGYWRNRQQSQPDHIEIVAEKLTVRSILQDIAKEFTIPLNITRGMNTLAPKKAIYDRFTRSKKDRLILLVVTDLDPAGETIAEDLVKSFKRDFEIEDDEIAAYKVALTIDQVHEFELEPSMEAKKKSPTYQAFVDKYDITDAYELEAMDPADLAETLEAAIKNVMDIDLYNQELAAEENDSAHIIAVQKKAREYLKSLGVIEPETPADAKPAQWTGFTEISVRSLRDF